MISDIFKAIAYQKSVLSFFGHWPDNPKPFYKHLLCAASYSVAIGLFITTTIETYWHFDDLSILTDHLCISIPPLSFLIKIILFRLKRSHLLELLEQMASPHLTFYPEEFNSLIQSVIDVSSVLSKLFTWAVSGVVALYCIIPFISSNNLPIRFSYNLGKWLYPMYVFETAALVNSALNNIALDILAVSLMGIAAAHLDILKAKMSNFANEAYLKNCIDHHNDIIRYVNCIENVYSNVFLAQYLTSIFNFCFVGFQLANTNPLSVQFAKMIFYSIAVTMQLGMYCWFGNEVIFKSLSIGDACYESDWPNFDRQTKISLMFIIQRSKKALALTPAGFSKLSLISFASVMQSSYSYFALMQRLYKDSVPT